MLGRSAFSNTKTFYPLLIYFLIKVISGSSIPKIELGNTISYVDWVYKQKLYFPNPENKFPQTPKSIQCLVNYLNKVVSEIMMTWKSSLLRWYHDLIELNFFWNEIAKTHLQHNYFDIVSFSTKASKLMVFILTCTYFHGLKRF